MINAYWEELEFHVPGRYGRRVEERIVDTALPLFHEANWGSIAGNDFA